MLFEDRSSMEADWRCGMERFWLTEYRLPGHEGDRVGGIVATKAIFDLELGSAFADGIAALSGVYLKGNDEIREAILAVALPFGQLWGTEAQSLLTGLLYGAAIHSLPRLAVDYDILGVEREMYYAHEGKLMIMTRPDVLVRRKADKTVWVPDWKTTSWKDVEWLLKWDYAIQLHIQAAAVKQSNPELDVQGSLILGAYKGYVNDATKERSSPFTYIFNNGGVGDLQWSPKWVRGWNRLPAALFESAGNNGMFAWVDYMKRTYPVILAEQFPVSQPIMLRQDMVDIIMRERTFRVGRFANYRMLPTMAQAAVKPTLFDHRTINCNRCNYKEACWNPTIHRDPTASGLYVPRRPNHELERKVQEEDERER